MLIAISNEMNIKAFEARLKIIYIGSWKLQLISVCMRNINVKSAWPSAGWLTSMSLRNVPYVCDVDLHYPLSGRVFQLGDRALRLVFVF
jgi:hypothetical protein